MKLTERDISDIITFCMYRLQTLGPEFRIGDDVRVDTDFFDATNTFGQCALGIDTSAHKFRHVISFNKHLMLDSLRDSIISTVYHEFCHYYQNREAIAKGYYYLEGDKMRTKDDPGMAKYFVGDDEGHSECWLKYVDKVNATLKPKIPVSAHPTDSEYDSYIKTNEYEDNVLFAVRCESCGREAKFLSYSRLDWFNFPPGMLTDIIKGQLRGQCNDYCKCGGCLKVLAKSEKTLYDIVKNEADWYFEDFLRSFIGGGSFNG